MFLVINKTDSLNLIIVAMNALKACLEKKKIYMLL